jgi:NAD-dependent deacetylase sirtuin 2
LERVANIPGEMLVEAHGSFASAHCIDCKVEVDTQLVKDAIFSDSIPKCSKCGGLVKPDIVFFGESLPSRFFGKMSEDFPKCDLLIVMGTSLQVQPFASLIHKVPASCPRILINREEVGKANATMLKMGFSTQGFRFGSANNYRDIGMIGELDQQVRLLVEKLGWTDELNAMIKGDK